MTYNDDVIDDAQSNCNLLEFSVCFSIFLRCRSTFDLDSTIKMTAENRLVHKPKTADIQPKHDQSRLYISEKVFRIPIKHYRN